MDRANPTLEQMAQHKFYSFGTNLVLSRLLIHVLVFEFQVGGLGNIWLIDSGCSRHMTGDRGGSPTSLRWCQRHTSPLGTRGEGVYFQKVK
jgi:hypothetical protein